MEKIQVILTSGLGIELIKADVPADLLRHYVEGLCSQFGTESHAVFIYYEAKLHRFDRLRKPEEYDIDNNSRWILDFDLIKHIEEENGLEHWCGFVRPKTNQ